MRLWHGLMGLMGFGAAACAMDVTGPDESETTGTSRQAVAAGVTDTFEHNAIYNPANGKVTSKCALSVPYQIAPGSEVVMASHTTGGVVDIPPGTPSITPSPFPEDTIVRDFSPGKAADHFEWFYDSSTDRTTVTLVVKGLNGVVGIGTPAAARPIDCSMQLVTGGSAGTMTGNVIWDYFGMGIISKFRARSKLLQSESSAQQSLQCTSLQYGPAGWPQWEAGVELTVNDANVYAYYAGSLAAGDIGPFPTPASSPPAASPPPPSTMGLFEWGLDPVVSPAGDLFRFKASLGRNTGLVHAGDRARCGSFSNDFNYNAPIQNFETTLSGEPAPQGSGMVLLPGPGGD